MKMARYASREVASTRMCCNENVIKHPKPGVTHTHQNASGPFVFRKGGSRNHNQERNSLTELKLTRNEPCGPIGDGAQTAHARRHQRDALDQRDARCFSSAAARASGVPRRSAGEVSHSVIA